MIIAVANHKGGTGKTTTAINLGRALSLQNKRILLVDMDPQGNLSYSLGLGNSQLTIGDLLSGKSTFDEVVQESNTMQVIPAATVLNKYAAELSATENVNLLLREKLENIKDRFDFIFIDCPPAISVYTLNALNAADGVLIPVLLEVLSVQGLDQVLKEINKIRQTTNPGLEVTGVLGTIVHENRKLSNEILEFIRDNFHVHIFNNHVRSNVKAAEAPSFASTVIDYSPSCASAKDYVSVAQELLLVLESAERKKHFMVSE